MKSNMKIAFENYFSKLKSLYSSTFGTEPTVPYKDTLEKSLLFGTPDEEGEIQWIPKEQVTKYDWSNCEKQLGFMLCKNLKEYFNTYFFLEMSGTFGSCELHFYGIDGSESLEETVLRNYYDAQYIFPETELFLIGNAVVNDDDSYFIYYDNSTGKLFCYESDTKNEILLSYSIDKTIGCMGASL